jgi:hypothetical protein
MKWLAYTGGVIVFLFVLVSGQLFYTEYKVAEIKKQEFRNPASTELPAVEFDEAWGPEQMQIANFIAQDSIKVAKENQTGTIMRRDAHPKHHGCVRSSLHIDNSKLPAAYRVGLFAEQGIDKDAWVRFSNGSAGSMQGDDRDKDVRGMAVKILGVPASPSGNYDLVMMSATRFFSKDAEDYIRLFHALQQGPFAIASYFALNPVNLARVAKARVSYENPLLIPYSSAVPYKLGSTSMRFRMLPCSNSYAHSVPLSHDGNNAMAIDLKEAVEAGESCFQFQVQPNEDLESNPTEDPRKTWAESKSPFYDVGVLTVRKDLEFGKYGQFCENINFNPWNTPPEQRPLGQINRIRQVAYKTVSKFRHDTNQAPELEPKDLEPCKNSETAKLCAP